MSSLNQIQPATKLVVTDWADVEGIREVSLKEAALYDSAFVYPVKLKEEILEVVRKRQALKKEFNDSIKLVFQLNNKLILEGRRDE